jgi:ubiquinone biosynthesis protein
MKLLQILWVWKKFRLGAVVQEFFPAGTRRSLKIEEDAPARLCAALEALGPLYVKFGQLLSTRRDLIPERFAVALSRLRDRVTPFDGDLAASMVEKSLRKPVNEVFERFDRTPLAAASIAQVHVGVLKDGREVVVKILRPRIRENIQKDIRCLYFLARWLPRFYRDFRRFRLKEVVAEIESTLMNEINLMAEAGNASALKRAFSENDVGRHVYIPEMIWEYTRPDLLVSERVFGVPISDHAALVSAGVDLPALAKIGVEVFYTQVFDFSFFHADLHPGNIFVDIADPAHPKYILVDFGIVGSLSAEDQHYLAANFLAFFERDYRKVAKLHIDSGWVTSKTRIDAFETAMRTVSEPVFGRPLKEISLGITMGQLFQIAKQFEMQIQPQLLLLQKTLLNIEALGRELDPELDLWGSCRPFFKVWMKRQIGWRGLWKRIKAEAPLISERLPELPGKLYRALSRLELQEKTIQEKPSGVAYWKGLTVGIIVGVLIMAVFFSSGYS